MEEKYVEKFFSRVYIDIPVFIYEVDLEYMSRRYNWSHAKTEEMRVRLHEIYRTTASIPMAI